MTYFNSLFNRHKYVKQNVNIKLTLQRAELSAGYTLIYILISDIRALWSARVPECQKFKM